MAKVLNLPTLIFQRVSISPYIMGSIIEGRGVTNVWPVIFILGMTASFLMFLLGSYEKRTEKILA